MNEIQKYDDAVKIIKNAILQSQYEAARSVNEKQLMLYYGIGKYISLNSRKGFWGEGAIDTISERLQKELPGLRGFTSRNLRFMRTFYEEWSILDSTKNYNSELTSSKNEMSLTSPIWNLQVPNLKNFPIDEFLNIGFTHHRIILRKVKNPEERLFYIKRCADEHFTVEELERSISADDFHHQAKLPNNFCKTLPSARQALKAIGSFKDEYLLDFINVEEIGARDKQDVDERVVENAIISFFVNDTEGAKNLLIGNAIKDARQKASVLAEASGVVLKEIQSIDYSWGELRFESRPEMIGMAPEGVLEDLRMDIEPDDIDATDNVTVVWAIE